jgi:hypothetical protein
MELGDVFAIYRRDEESGHVQGGHARRSQRPAFLTDFKRLYNVYERTAFRKFAVRDGKLYMKFGTGAGLNDFAVFWDSTTATCVCRRPRGGRVSPHRLSAGHEFRWLKPDREAYRYGDHPHISIEDRVFVECVGGDLTIKVEDNTANGRRHLREPVDDRIRKVDDAEIEYAIVDHLIVLKIRPYKEQDFRYFIFNEKQHTVGARGFDRRILRAAAGGPRPDFPDGYYLATGELETVRSKDAGRCSSSASSTRPTARTCSTVSTTGTRATTRCCPTG